MWRGTSLYWCVRDASRHLLSPLPFTPCVVTEPSYGRGTDEGSWELRLVLMSRLLYVMCFNGRGCNSCSVGIYSNSKRLFVRGVFR